jgi:hypothetical protein
MTHDPRPEIEKLRDELASHEKPICFLLGAGTTASVRVNSVALVPAMPALTTVCIDAVKLLGEPYSAAIDQVADETSGTGPRNIELILSRLRLMVEAIGDHDKLAGLDAAQLRQVDALIRTTIASAANIDETAIPSDVPHADFAAWVARVQRVAPVEIFTTNYDILVERSLELANVAVFDGFVGSYRPFFDASCLDRVDSAPGPRWARLWKIHGSVNWYFQDSPRRRVCRGEPTDSGELILPSHYKYDESRRQPYVALLDHLARVLRQDNVILVTAGFGFGDQHINAVLFDAVASNPRAHIFALQHGELPDGHDLIARAKTHSNLLVYGPESAVIRGERARWRLLDPVDEKTASLMDVAFDSDATLEPDAVPLTGRFRLGDFEYLGRFLRGLES